MKVLVVVAHPDDEVIMCGATINKLIRDGHNINITYCTRNEEAYFRSENSKKRSQRAVIEAKRSASFLGFDFNFLNFRDMCIEDNKGLLIKELIKEIRRIQPDVIITHHAGDKHIDHRTLGEVVPEANFQSGCLLCGGNIVWSAKLVIQGEIDLELSTPFNFQIVSTVLKVDVRRKIDAFKYYESVKTEHKTTQNWLFKRLEMVASLRGMVIGQDYGEAFIINNYSPLSSESVGLMKLILKR